MYNQDARKHVANAVRQHVKTNLEETTAKHLKADAVQVRTPKRTAKRRVVFVHLLVRPLTAVIGLEEDVLDLNETVVEADMCNEIVRRPVVAANVNVTNVN